MRATSFLLPLFDEFTACDNRTVADDGNIGSEINSHDIQTAEIDIIASAPPCETEKESIALGAGELHLSSYVSDEVIDDHPTINSEELSSPVSSRLLPNLDAETPVKDEPLLSNMLAAAPIPSIYELATCKDSTKLSQNGKSSFAEALSNHDREAEIAHLPQDLTLPTLTRVTVESVSDSLLAASGQKELNESPEETSDTRLVETNSPQENIVTLKHEVAIKSKPSPILAEKNPKEKSISDKLQEIAKIDVRSIVLKNGKDITSHTTNIEDRGSKVSLYLHV